MDVWHALIGGESVTFEIQWRRTPGEETSGEDAVSDFLWTSTACMPVIKNGAVTSIFACHTDVTAQKEATMTALLRMETERRLASFTEMAPVGLYQLDSNWKITYCNDQWFRITGYPRMPMDQIDWQSICLDMNSLQKDIDMVKASSQPHTFSFRLKKLWIAPDGIPAPTWILATATSHFDTAGKLASVIGTMTDISHLKWAEELQKRRVEEALESKRQQENFIDMTSHGTQRRCFM
jgi:PAS domain S-box-containing protein